MERFSDKSGRSMCVVKRLIETGLQCYSKNFSFILLLKSVISKALQYKVDLKLKILNVCIAMCPLVMSLSSRDFIMTSSNTIKHGNKLTVIAKRLSARHIIVTLFSLSVYIYIYVRHT